MKNSFAKKTLSIALITSIVTGGSFSIKYNEKFNIENPLNIMEVYGNTNDEDTSIFFREKSDNSINVNINKGYLYFEEDELPINKDGRVLVPLRAIFEALNATVEWDNATKTVIATSDDGKVINLGIDIGTYTVDGVKKYLDVPATVINDRTMIPVRAISESLGCTVEWSENEQTVYIETTIVPPFLYNDNISFEVLDKEERTTNSLFSTSKGRTASVISNAIFYKNNVEHYITTSNSEVSIKSEDGKFTKTIPFELPIYGGFYQSSNNEFYLIFGQTNEEESNSKEVIRIVKYDEDFNTIDSLSLTGKDLGTTIPFHSGSLRVAEDGNNLFIHTSRKRFAGSDGVNHQSQLSLYVNTETMKLDTQVNDYQENHVSHSFNQFVVRDTYTSKYVVLDQGDAYPRSIYIQDPQGDFGKSLLEIAGDIGDNATGLTIGGFDFTSETYITAINKVDFNKVKSFGSTITIDIDERDIVLLVFNKTKNSTDTITLANYVGTGKTGSTPELIKIDDNKFMVMWQEFDATSGEDAVFKYVYVDKYGKSTSSVYTERDVLLISDNCTPVYYNNQVSWITESEYGTSIIRINVE